MRVEQPRRVARGPTINGKISNREAAKKRRWDEGNQTLVMAFVRPSRLRVFVVQFFVPQPTGGSTGIEVQGRRSKALVVRQPSNEYTRSNTKM